MSNELTLQLCAIAKTLGCNFTVRDNPIAPEKVFADNGLLPALVRRADQLASFCLGYGLGASFDDAHGSMTGTKVKLDDATPNSLRLLCITDVLIEMIQMSPSREVVPLDDLLYD